MKKKSTLKIILITLAAIIALLAVVVAMQPTELRVERSTTIAAPAEAVFVQVNDLHNWDAWSPWAKLDPAAKVTHEGSPSGTGAVYSWAGNSEVGEGRMTITDSRPNELVRIKLEFLKPFAAVNATDFNFKQEGGQTAVTWTMTGKKNFLMKGMGLIMDCDKMIGGDFEKGLSQMKAVVESGAKKTT